MEASGWSPPSEVFLISSLPVGINPLSTFSDPASRLEYFWWRRRESNPRLEHLSFNFFPFGVYNNSFISSHSNHTVKLIVHISIIPRMNPTKKCSVWSHIYFVSRNTHLAIISFLFFTIAVAASQHSSNLGYDFHSCSTS